MTSFDTYADNYASALAQGLAVSGEDSSYYVRGRVGWLKRCLEGLQLRPAACLDYGCGCGDSAGELVRTLGLKQVTGVDVSVREIEIARRKYPGTGTCFLPLSELAPAPAFDLAYCNGVFHHILPPERLRCLHYIRDCLKPGGVFAFWENNPWNPGTRYVMSRIPFDREAITLSPPQAVRLLRAAGFRIVHTTFHFVFPRALQVFRPLERWLVNFPVGAQYQVLCVKD